MINETNNIINEIEPQKEGLFGGENNKVIKEGLKLDNKLEINKNIIKNKGNEFDKNEEMKRKEIKKRGNPNWKKGMSTPNPGGKRKEFSLKNDLVKALKRIKHKDPAKYREIIESYWENKAMRQFLMEIIDGKARQSTELSGNMSNPIRIIEVRPMIEGENEAK